MAPVSLKEVIVYSSQDPVHRADNLLQQASPWKRWLCAPGDRTGSMQAEFQLEKAAKIGYIDIGNYGSAFVEVLVRKSSWSSSQYVTLIPATMLMSPMESKNGKNRCVVKMFSKAAVSEESLAGEWDRVKVICSQPYKKDSQFGLAFLRLRSLEEQPAAPTESVSPGPTMTKLHSNSATTPTGGKSKSRTILSPSWKTNSIFQRQLVAANDGGNKHGDAELKTRLLKIAATADAGSDKSSSLSRSAKMVIASAKQPTPRQPTSSRGNDAPSPPLNGGRRGASSTVPNGQSADRRSKAPASQGRPESDVENRASPHLGRREHGNAYHADKESALKMTPEQRNRLGSDSNRQESHSGGDQGQRGPVGKRSDAWRPAKRPSNLPPETSPLKMSIADSNTADSFKQVAEDFLQSLGENLLNVTLSDIRPILQRCLKRKLGKEEKKTLKELAVERVDFLIKSRSPVTARAAGPGRNPQPTLPPKPKPSSPQSLASTSPPPPAVNSNNLRDVEGTEFRSCQKCFLNFTARQITGHALTCRGIKSAGSITMATSAFSASDAGPAPKRGGGRGRGRGSRGGRKGQAGKTAPRAASAHVRTAPMPRYSGEGAVAKRKRGGGAANPPTRNPAATTTSKLGGVAVDAATIPQPESCRIPTQEGAPTAQQQVGADQCDYAPCPICFDNYPMAVIEQHADLCLERRMILEDMAQRQTPCF